ALGRQPGEALVSARGRSRRDFETIRRSVGERVWTALYQGVPTPTTGGLFAAEDLNKHRCQSSDIIGRVVSVDPSDSGTGDEAGILIMGWDDYGNVIVEEDHSAPMTSATWSKEAVSLAISTGAGDIVYEAFTAEATYRAVLENAWHDIHRQAELLRQTGGDTVAAAQLWHDEGRGGDGLGAMQETLGILDLVPV
ncbi:hypothetical protein, partial [Pseudomonas aeruginosa]